MALVVFKPDLDDQLVSFSALTLIWPVKIVPKMTYYVSSGTLNLTHSLTHIMRFVKSLMLTLWAPWKFQEVWCPQWIWIWIYLSRAVVWTVTQWENTGAEFGQDPVIWLWATILQSGYNKVTLEPACDISLNAHWTLCRQWLLFFLWCFLICAWRLMQIFQFYVCCTFCTCASVCSQFVIHRGTTLISCVCT